MVADSKAAKVVVAASARWSLRDRARRLSARSSRRRLVEICAHAESSIAKQRAATAAVAAVAARLLHRLVACCCSERARSSARRRRRRRRCGYV